MNEWISIIIERERVYIYQKTFRASTQARGFFKRQSGKGQFGGCMDWIYSKRRRKKASSLKNAIVGVVPRELSQRLKKAESMANASCWLPNRRRESQTLRWFIPRCRPSETAFKVAASLASLKEALRSHKSAILLSQCDACKLSPFPLKTLRC